MNLLKKFFSKKEEPIRTYNDFWNWFQLHEKQFFEVVKANGDVEKLFFEKIGPKLNELRPGFFYVTGMIDPKTVELIITADGEIKNFVFVEELVAASPAISGWKFTALKPSLDITDVTIEMDGTWYSKDNLFFYPNDEPGYPDEVSITLVHEQYTEGKDAILTGIYIFLDNYLGELDFANTIDTIRFSSKASATADLIPIEKLKDYLRWREKEFVEKYVDTEPDPALETYSIYESSLGKEGMLVAVLNSALFTWEGKASHPWLLTVRIPYDGRKTNGLPDSAAMELLESIETTITQKLTDAGSAIYIGRQSARNTRSIFFACKEFRTPSRIVAGVQLYYSHKTPIDYEIYKDKYWQTFNQFVS
ncbi:DUF695 domain-containing protein [Flavihumibacter sp. CACIAM 22H1]|uniref:DUF695 domain-containing protein n=1 Tax=Flavihumibacter sp. CACIAM 22H1 TaxID=1812911 RepID=UPI0007A85924|nr:DUF695 domain-containing protein [Flavihumibacter sp. CACIAM 22H1]KYP16369.1 MAG: hypothetical protein A1D16_17060 [Flavihumibacter sp. CACIAM 22H1]